MAANTEASFAKINTTTNCNFPLLAQADRLWTHASSPFFCFSYYYRTHIHFLSAFNIKLRHPTTPIFNLLPRPHSSTKRKSHSCLLSSLLSTSSMTIADESFLDNFYQLLHKIFWNVLAHELPTSTWQRHAKESVLTARTCFTL